MKFNTKVKWFLYIGIIFLLALPYSLLSWFLLIACFFSALWLWRASNDELYNYLEDLKRKEEN